MRKNIFILILLFIYILIQKDIIINILLNKNKKRVCVINLMNSQNVGNILVKFSLFKKLKELGFNTTIVTSMGYPNVNISFLNRTTNFLLIKNVFSELNENDYDYIVVNSDQTWRNYDKKYFYDIAFLYFARNWKIPKFIYGTSIGSDYWAFKKEDDEIAKKLLKNFKGISFREKGLISLAEKHLKIKGEFVLDPTLLIDKKYYLNEIQNYHNFFNLNDKFIFIYQLDKNENIDKIIKESAEKFNYKIHNHVLKRGDYIESFIYEISKCQAVITDSYHGTLFSIMFNKPFLSFINRERGKGRFDSLIEIFNITNRIIDTKKNQTIDINLLEMPLNLNLTLFNKLQNYSINFLKRNLDI